MRVPFDMHAPFTKHVVARNNENVKVGEGLFVIEMTDWLIDVAGLLGRAWRETHDDRMITPTMLIAWHQHVNTRLIRDLNLRRTTGTSDLVSLVASVSTLKRMTK